MEHISDAALSPEQGSAQALMLGPGVKRWQLRNIVFCGADTRPCNELTDVWVELFESSGRAGLHCWTHAIRECSDRPFSVCLRFQDVHGRTLHEVEWLLSIPGDLDVEYRLQAPFPAWVFPASTWVAVPALSQRIRPRAP